MTDPELERRAEVARRLKAARWLAGTVRIDEKGKARVVALSPQELAERPPLPENEITSHLIGAIERMERPTRPMELTSIAHALRVPKTWFSESPTAINASLENVMADVALGLKALADPEVARQDPELRRRLAQFESNWRRMNLDQWPLPQERLPREPEELIDLRERIDQAPADSLGEDDTTLDLARGTDPGDAENKPRRAG
jgi:hypothetical protein